MEKAIINSNIDVTKSMKDRIDDMVAKINKKHSKHIKENLVFSVKSENSVFETSLKIPVKGADVFVTASNQSFYLSMKELQEKANKKMEKLN